MIRLTRCILAEGAHSFHYFLPQTDFERRGKEVSSVAKQLLKPSRSAEGESSVARQPLRLIGRVEEVSSVVRQRLKDGEGSGCVPYMPEPGDPEFDEWLEGFEKGLKQSSIASKGGQGDFFVGCGSN